MATTKKRTTKKTTSKKKAPAKKRSAPTIAERLATLEKHMDMVYGMARYASSGLYLLERRAELDQLLGSIRERIIELGDVASSDPGRDAAEAALATATYQLLLDVHDLYGDSEGWERVFDAMHRLSNPPCID